jgi:general secretion pathway protein A
MYESFYRLTGKPFQLNPDPAFFFGSRGHKRALAYLQYGVYQREGFIVITGEVGAGKTTLIGSLLDQLDAQKFVAAQLVSTQLDADDMLRAVALAFGVPQTGSDKARVLADLQRFLASLHAQHKRALLIVDEAQNLTQRAVEELRMLSNFQVGDTALLQSFLVGQPELRDLMRSPHMQQLRQRVIASYHLGPMDQQETEAYIKHRLTHVGWKGDPEFDTSALDAIYAFAGGIPRRINAVCNRLMLAGYLSENHLLRAADVEAVVEELKEEFGDEIGPQAVLTPAANEPTASAPAMTGSPTSQALEPRVERLERAMVSALDILHRLVSLDQTKKTDATSGLQ